MFNIGPAELLVIAVVLLIAVGPEQLPGVIRRAGTVVAQARSMTEGLRSEFMAGLDEIEQAVDPHEWGPYSGDSSAAPRNRRATGDRATRTAASDEERAAEPDADGPTGDADETADGDGEDRGEDWVSIVEDDYDELGDYDDEDDLDLIEAEPVDATGPTGGDTDDTDRVDEGTGERDRADTGSARMRKPPMTHPGADHPRATSGSTSNGAGHPTERPSPAGAEDDA